MTYGYSREVVLPIPITPPARLSPGAPVTLRGQASWLACEKTCIPEEAPIALTLPVTSGVPPADPRGAPLIAAARQSVPTPSPWPASFVATREDVTLTLTVAGLTSKRITDVWFFPSRWGPIDLAAPQRARVDVEGIRLDVARGPLRDAVAAPIDGVLVVAERLDGGVARHAFAVTASPRSVDGLLDPTGVVGKAYGATNTPHMYIVDKAGLLVYAGAIDDRPTTRRADVQGAHNYVRAALEDMATGRAVQTPVTRAYGCTVKYA
jgi:hypothetical protein